MVETNKNHRSERKYKMNKRINIAMLITLSVLAGCSGAEMVETRYQTYKDVPSIALCSYMYRGRMDGLQIRAISQVLSERKEDCERFNELKIKSDQRIEVKKL